VLKKVPLGAMIWVISLWVKKPLAKTSIASLTS
jgi:hypothetical protein